MATRTSNELPSRQVHKQEVKEKPCRLAICRFWQNLHRDNLKDYLKLFQIGIELLGLSA